QAHHIGVEATQGTAPNRFGGRTLLQWGGKGWLALNLLFFFSCVRYWNGFLAFDRIPTREYWQQAFPGLFTQSMDEKCF
ncbi:MAG: hypothetical protein WCP58_03460, partial [bacterium]